MAVKGDVTPPPRNVPFKQAYPDLVMLSKTSMSPSDAMKQLISKQELAKELEKNPLIELQAPASSSCSNGIHVLFDQRQAMLSELQSHPVFIVSGLSQAAHAGLISRHETRNVSKLQVLLRM